MDPVNVARDDGSEYDRRWYEKLRAGARRSAAAIAAVVDPLIEPKTAIDVGCGCAAFAAAFLQRGATVRACDGAYALEAGLDIPVEQFTAVDLRDAAACRRLVGGAYDLAICLEVAEHLPEESADGLVDLLCALSPVVLFSAAVPRQKGKNHINLQWPNYWAARFERHRLGCMDLLRPLLSYDASIEPWYRQNMLLFVAESRYDGIMQRALALGLIERALRAAAPMRHPDFK
jgi:hypothetical protein